MAGAPDRLPGMQGSPDFDAAVPTPDHFIPLLYLAGLGAAAGAGRGRAGRRLRLRLAVDDGLHPGPAGPGGGGGRAPDRGAAGRGAPRTAPTSDRPLPRLRSDVGERVTAEGLEPGAVDPGRQVRRDPGR